MIKKMVYSNKKLVQYFYFILSFLAKEILVLNYLRFSYIHHQSFGNHCAIYGCLLLFAFAYVDKVFKLVPPTVF